MKNKNKVILILLSLVFIIKYSVIDCSLYFSRILYEKELKTDFYTVRFPSALNKEIFTGTVRALY